MDLDLVEWPEDVTVKQLEALVQSLQPLSTGAYERPEVYPACCTELRLTTPGRRHGCGAAGSW